MYFSYACTLITKPMLNLSHTHTHTNTHTNSEISREMEEEIEEELEGLRQAK